MTTAQMAEMLRIVRAAVELDEEAFNEEAAENICEKLDAAIRLIEK